MAKKKSSKRPVGRRTPAVSGAPKKRRDVQNLPHAVVMSGHIKPGEASLVIAKMINAIEAKHKLNQKGDR
jgi:hypothetical protein